MRYAEQHNVTPFDKRPMATELREAAFVKEYGEQGKSHYAIYAQQGKFEFDRNEIASFIKEATKKSFDRVELEKRGLSKQEIDRLELSINSEPIIKKEDISDSEGLANMINRSTAAVIETQRRFPHLHGAELVNAAERAQHMRDLKESLK